MLSKVVSTKTPSIKTVARLAGVSPATVSNALNGKPSVAAELVARVRAAADSLGYAADNHASRLRSGKRSLAGVVVPDLGNPMFGAFVSVLEQAARRDGVDLLVVSAANDPAEEAARLRAIRSWRPGGLIVIPCDGGFSARLPAGPMPPIVVADRIPDEPLFDLVAVDNVGAAAEIGAHLAAEGYRDCLVVGTTLAITNVRERWDGARGAGGPMTTVFLDCGFDAEAARGRLLAHLGRAPRPAALFTLDHRTALVAYGALAELGLVAGRDIGFASFDESEWMRLVTPAITTVRQPVEAMADMAWRRLSERMADETGPPRMTRLDCAIEIRGSTLRTPGRPETAAA